VCETFGLSVHKLVGRKALTTACAAPAPAVSTSGVNKLKAIWGIHTRRVVVSLLLSASNALQDRDGGAARK
jgi:hypothetical protein